MASLFPHSPAIDEKTRRFVAGKAPVEPKQRVTITPVGIRCARAILVLVSGFAKSATPARVFAEGGDVHETPARLVRGVVWIVDQGAASALPVPQSGSKPASNLKP
jgi:6-phosphogluconolactonase/glucosamine-6-phosphate isomerase/deaminase